VPPIEQRMVSFSSPPKTVITTKGMSYRMRKRGADAQDQQKEARSK
jgi:hypothetical protein